MSITEFLLARIAEDEVSAERAQAVYDRDDPMPAQFLGAYLDPARVLAECEAKRRIVEFYAEMHAAMLATRPAKDVPAALTVGAESALESALCLLALPYADNPAYDESWRP